MKQLFVLPLMVVLLAACVFAVQEGDAAHQALEDFFQALNRADYASADALYRGEYGTLAGWNPDVDPQDHAKLWERGCQQNGLRCLSVRSASLIDQSGDTFIFNVEFNNPDGALFVRGPCCGADETEMPPESQFEFHVVKTAEGKFLVADLPVYVP
jgi:hypothetical protein